MTAIRPSPSDPALGPAAEPGVDLVVAGAGGGLIGALRAAQLGLSVLVVEKNEHFLTGNNTSMSTAMIPGAGSRWQREAGIEDSPARFLADVLRKTHGEADPEVAGTLTQVSARLVEWMADEAGLELSLVTEFEYPGHSVPRCHSVPGRSGRSVLTTLLAKVRRHPLIDVMVPAQLVSAELGPQELVNVTVRTPAGDQEIAAGALLLACNGFGADAEAVRRRIPEIAGAVYHGSEGSTGEAIEIGRRLGADVRQLDAYQGHAALAMPAATLVGWATVMHGGFLVDAAGRRFGDETVGYSEYASTILQRAEGRAWIVLDRRVHEACLTFTDYQDTVSSRALKWAATPAELAVLIGIDPDGLTDTVQRTRAIAEGREDDSFGRTHWEAPLAGELAAVAVSPALFHTQGGLHVDRDARALRPDGSPIAGLYAAGGTAVGMSGSGAAGYLAGNGLLSAFGLSFLAAEHVAERHQKVPAKASC